MYDPPLPDGASIQLNAILDQMEQVVNEPNDVHSHVKIFLQLEVNCTLFYFDYPMENKLSSSLRSGSQFHKSCWLESI